MAGENKIEYWLHRITGGENGYILSYPLLSEYNLLSIGWSFISSESIAKDIQEHGLTAIRKAYSEKKADWSRNVHSLLHFVHDMHKGHIVVVPIGAYLSIYRIADEIIYTNDNIPSEYLTKYQVVRKQDGISTTDGQYIDLGFYRKVELVAANILRSEAEEDLYKKTKAFHTNLNISEVHGSVDKLIATHQGNQHHSTPSHLISDLEVKNYKNINYLQLKGLRRLNLFVGANNAGKSNLLEAISLYAANFSPLRLKEILAERHEDLESFEEGNSIDERERISAFASFFPQRSVDRMASGTSIQLNTAKEGIQLYLKTAIFRDDTTVRRLARLSPYEMVTPNQMVYNLRESVLIAQPADGKHSAHKVQTKHFEDIMQMIRISNRSTDFQPNNTRNRFPYKHLNCKQLGQSDIEKIWAEIAMTKMEDEVLHALQIVDSRVQKFDFIKINSHTYSPMVLLEGADNKMPITEMGDGMTHILNIVATMVACHDGIVLLDEIESGLHYTTQMKLWGTISQLSEDYNIQVFATTHSNDCIDAFTKQSLDGDGILIRIEKRGDKLYAQSYIDKEQVMSMRSNDMEIR